MARPAARALAGYFPTPAHLIPSIAALLDPSSSMLPHREYGRDTYGSLTFLDPCAGDGAALFSLVEAVCGPLRLIAGPKPTLYACEMEQERAAALKDRFRSTLEWAQQSNALHTDAFNLVWQTSPSAAGAHVLYLNPPYDDDREFSRLEHRWLVRFTASLVPSDGVLLFVVPNYALAASCNFIAAEYQPQSLHCFRFPEPDFTPYKQVVLIAKRSAAPLPNGWQDKGMVQRLNAWATDPETIPVLPLAGKGRRLVQLAWGEKGGFSSWQAATVDVAAVTAALRPELQSATRGELTPVKGLGLTNLAAMFARPVEVALPPRPAHLVTALAADFFNGAQVKPNDGVGPSGLIKATFTPTYVDVQERVNSKGKVTSILQVQQPILNITFLDTDSGKIYRLKQGTTTSGCRDPEGMTIADFVDGYSDSLLRVLDTMCPALHDPRRPEHRISLPRMARTLYDAQAHAAMAGLKLLHQGSDFILLGEIGSGKSITSLACAYALSQRNFRSTTTQLDRLAAAKAARYLKPVRVCLIFCPPHLLKSWQDQIRLTLPGAKAIILDCTADVDRLATLHDTATSDEPGSGLTFAILSRETGKLGHKLAASSSTNPRCPRCAAPIVEPAEKIVSQRLRCEHQAMTASDQPAALSIRLAQLLAPLYPDETRVCNLCSSRYLLRLGMKLAATQRINEAIGDDAARDMQTEIWRSYAIGNTSPIERTRLGRLLLELTDAVVRSIETGSERETLGQMMTALIQLGIAMPHKERDTFLADLCRRFYRASLTDPELYGIGADLRRRVRELLLTLTPGCMVQAMLTAELKAMPLPTGPTGTNHWEQFDRAIARLLRETKGVAINPGQYQPDYSYNFISAISSISYHDYNVGDSAAALAALETLVGISKFATSAPCDAPLYQATANPRRYPLATYISRYRRHLIDMVIVDEAHEYSAEGSAQRLAAGRLIEMGKPTMLLTGSVMKGYADSLFANFWAIDREFRQEYSYDDATKFVQAYGYLKREVRFDDDEREHVYGTMSDRKLEAEKGRIVGLAPGVMPQFIVRLLRKACTIDLDALGLDLPACRQIAMPITPDPDDESGKQIIAATLELQRTVIDRIVQDRYEPGFAGKLMYALPMVATYPDRCTTDTGRGLVGGERAFALHYPQDIGGGLVAAAPLFPSHILTPKEQRLVALVKQELKQGRRPIIYLWNTGDEAGLVKRLEGILRLRAGVKVAVLDAKKVDARSRQDWIDQEVIQKRADVLIVNARAVETGLNNLIYFSTVIWYENPMCNAITFRQANGRVYRNGQTKEVRIYILFYRDTSQAAMMSLWLQKVSESQKADGQDWQASLEAAGAGGEVTTSAHIALGEALYRKMQEQEKAAPEFATIEVAATVINPAPPESAPPVPTPPAPRKLVFGNITVRSKMRIQPVQTGQMSLFGD